MSAIKRLERPNFLTLAAALDLSKGTTIDGIERLAVLDVKDRKTGADGDGKPWSCQAMKVRQEGQEAWMSVFNFPDLSFLNGGNISLESTEGGNGKTYGLTIDEYKGERKLKLSDSALIDNMDAKEQPDKQPHNLTAHGVGAGAAARERPRQQEAPARQREAPQRETTQRGSDVRQPANVKKPIHGATVGMAINQANSILLRLHADDAAYFSSPQYSKDLGELASDIVRVSQYMESGHLAPSANARAKADQQASDAPTGQETRPARQPQQFVVEGYGPEDSKQGGCPDQRDVSSFKEDLESDDIPW